MLERLVFDPQKRLAKIPKRRLADLLGEAQDGLLLLDRRGRKAPLRQAPFGGAILAKERAMPALLANLIIVCQRGLHGRSGVVGMKFHQLSLEDLVGELGDLIVAALAVLKHRIGGLGDAIEAHRPALKMARAGDGGLRHARRALGNALRRAALGLRCALRLRGSPAAAAPLAPARSARAALGALGQRLLVSARGAALSSTTAELSSASDADFLAAGSRASRNFGPVLGLDSERARWVRRAPRARRRPPPP